MKRKTEMKRMPRSKYESKWDSKVQLFTYFGRKNLLWLQSSCGWMKQEERVKGRESVSESENVFKIRLMLKWEEI